MTLETYKCWVYALLRCGNIALTFR
jgi:hypothetical protein